MPAVTGVDVEVPFSLQSADGGRYECTNYVRGYSGLLDYVFFQPEHMSAREVLPLPSMAELAGWIPSQRFPLDHLSLVFDLEWLPSADAAASAQHSQTSERTAGSTAGSGVAAAGGVVEQPQPSGSRHAEADATGVPGSSGSASALQASASGVDGHGMSEQEAAQAAEVSARMRGSVFPADEGGAVVAADALRRGDVVAVPTDTLYGLAACANSEQVGLTAPSSVSRQIPAQQFLKDVSVK